MSIRVVGSVIGGLDSAAYASVWLLCSPERLPRRRAHEQEHGEPGEQVHVPSSATTPTPWDVVNNAAPERWGRAGRPAGAGGGQGAAPAARPG